jgi:HNH endonuclease
MSCTVSGCDGKHYGRGYCWKHYLRWRRHGDPLVISRAENGEPMRFVLEVAVPYRDDDCLLWPFSRRPHSMINIGNRQRENVSRLICRKVHGRPPSTKHGALHSCGNGRCVNPQHIYWGTQKQNMADAKRHGTFKVRRGKMSDEAKQKISESMKTFRRKQRNESAKSRSKIVRRRRLT